MSYRLSTGDDGQKRESLGAAIRRLLPLMLQERQKIAIAFASILVTSAATLASPYIIGQTVDRYISHGDYSGVIRNALILLAIYLVALVTSYVQTRTMGGVGRRILFNLRNALFTKLQELPVAFFNQNRAGDLISRINNDTDKLNQFFAQALMQFLSNGFLIVGSGILLVVLNVRLGGARCCRRQRC
jgi:ATP-binding cassette subfamily B protein